jgi:nucleotide-binding universal stress UspA family protein
MRFRTLIVHVDTTDEGRARLHAAIDLARKLNAKLVGLGAFGFAPEPDPTGMSHKILRDWIADSLRQAEACFRRATADLGEASWLTDRRSPAQALAAHACGADLVVASRTARITAPESFAQPDELILSAGAPVLLQPPAAGPLAARTIVVGWKNTRESRRALWDGLPFLISAEQVRLIRFEASERPDESLDEAGGRLRRHGVKLEIEHRQPSRGTIGEDLVEAASALGADLIVAGGYGRSRIHELVLGGVTRNLLATCPHYVLFSH